MPSRSRVFALRWIPLIFLIVPIQGCGGNPNITSPTDEITPTDPVTLADGWTQMNIVANFAKTDLDTNAHFDTSRNACGKEADGALLTPLWNRIAAGTNQAVAENALSMSNEACSDIPDGNRMDGTVEVVTANSAKRLLFEIRGGQLCTLIPKTDVAGSLVSAISDLITAADKEDCPNGWGH